MKPVHISVAASVIVAIALQCICPSCLLAAEGEGESWRERFLTEAPRKWQEYRSHSDRFQGFFTMLSWDLRGWWPTVIEKSTAELKQNQPLGCALSNSVLEVHRKGEVIIDPQRVNGVNPHYKFQLIQSGPKGSWILTSWEPVGTQSKAANTNAVWNHGTALLNGGDQISTLMSHPRFKVVSVTGINKEGKELIRVEIDFHPERENELMYSWLRTGWLLFDPQKYWMLVEYEGTGAYDGGVGITHGSYKYETGPGGLPLLKRHVVSFMGNDAKGKPVKLAYEYQFDPHEGDVPEREFYLSAFGLPEPNFAANGMVEPMGLERKKGLPTYLWALIGAGVCGAMAFGFRYLARRRRGSVA